MLITCPECELQVSDKAITCPHCGYPLRPDAVQRTSKSRKANKRRRLPNGFGQISEIKNRNLRKPFRAMVTVGKTSTGRPICKPLKPESYFATYNEAYEALLEYHKNPYDLEPDITMKQLYEMWTEEYFSKISVSNKKTTEAAWNYMSTIYDMRVKDVKVRTLKGVIEDGVYTYRGDTHHMSAYMKVKAKSMFNLMFDYAVENEIVDKNIARNFSTPTEIVKEGKKMHKGHIPYTEEEMEILWQNINKVQFVDLMVIQCYSGWRPQEMCLLEVSRVDIENWTFTGGIKTEAGTDRVVPIHTRIRELVKKYYDEAIESGRKYLFATETGEELTYGKYWDRYNKTKKRLGINIEHKCHDGRVHFVTEAKKAGMDEYAIKYIVGHAISDVTERVYTKRELEWLVSEIEKIK